MATEVIEVTSFNRGLISRRGLARVDVDRVSLSSVELTNWLPRTLGSASPRSGLKYTGYSTYNNERSYNVPFIYDRNDTGVFEFTNNRVLFIVDDIPITRSPVNTVIFNSDFDSNITSWSDNSDSAGSIGWESTGSLYLVGDGYNSGRAYQVVSVDAADQGVLHGLAVSVVRGEVTIYIGTSLNTDDVISRTKLTEGEYSLAFTPNASSIYVHVESSTKYKSFLNYIGIEPSGVTSVKTPIVENDLKYLRFDQIEDKIYMACRGYKPFYMARYGVNSFGLVYINPNDGAFDLINDDLSSTVTPSAKNGDISITSTKPIFKSGHVGSLFKIDSIGQSVSGSLSGGDQWSDYIRITGVGSSRIFDISISGTWSGTLMLQKSVDDANSWVDATKYVGNTTTTYNDGKDNEISYYRIGFKAGDYVSGTASVSLDYARGSIAGVCKITKFLSDTKVDAIVLKPLGGLDASPNWYHGVWSSERGFPSAVSLHEGRLVYIGAGVVVASVSESYESFDDSIEGDSRSFVKSIPATGSYNVSSSKSLSRLFIATEMNEVFLRSSSYNEPLTPSNSAFKAPSNYGATSDVDSIIVDSSVFMVQRGGERLIQVLYSIDKDDYQPNDVTRLVPELMQSGIKRIALQRTPDTRIYCVMGDGTCMVYIHDVLEDVKCWAKIETDGVIEDVYVLPDDQDDRVYFVVARTIGGNVYRYREKLALERNTIGGNNSYLLDSYVVYSGTSTNVISGLGHLEGKQVAVWGDGKNLSLKVNANSVSSQTLYTVSGGAITLNESVSDAVIGLPYKSRYKGTLLQPRSVKGSSLLQRKKIRQIGFMAQDVHGYAIRYGDSFNNLSDVPRMYQEVELGLNDVIADYSPDMHNFGDSYYKNDLSLCIEVLSPMPCTLLGVVMEVEMNEKGANK